MPRSRSSRARRGGCSASFSSVEAVETHVLRTRLREVEAAAAACRSERARARSRVDAATPSSANEKTKHAGEAAAAARAGATALRFAPPPPSLSACSASVPRRLDFCLLDPRLCFRGSSLSISAFPPGELCLERSLLGLSARLRRLRGASLPCGRSAPLETTPSSARASAQTSLQPRSGRVTSPSDRASRGLSAPSLAAVSVHQSLFGSRSGIAGSHRSAGPTLPLQVRRFEAPGHSARSPCVSRSPTWEPSPAAGATSRRRSPRCRACSVLLECRDSRTWAWNGS